MKTLLLRLEGPMQSWGTSIRFREVPTESEPTFSGVLGLLAAALGRRRGEDLSDLTALRMGVRVDRPGRMEIDYHIAGGAHGEPDQVRWGLRTAGNARARQTMQTWRGYLADASFLVGLEGNESTLSLLEKALLTPVFPPYLGRKAFPPSRRLLDQIVTTPLEQALEEAPWFARRPGERPPAPLRLVLPDRPSPKHQVRSEIPHRFTYGERDYAPRVTSNHTLDLPEERIVPDPCTLTAFP